MRRVYQKEIKELLGITVTFLIQNNQTSNQLFKIRNLRCHLIFQEIMKTRHKIKLILTISIPVNRPMGLQIINFRERIQVDNYIKQVVIIDLLQVCKNK